MKGKQCWSHLGCCLFCFFVFKLLCFEQNNREMLCTCHICLSFFHVCIDVSQQPDNSLKMFHFFVCYLLNCSKASGIHGVNK